MQLITILDQPDLGEDDRATLYVERPWSPEAEAIIVAPAPETTGPIARDGRSFEYFLEAFIARDFLDDLDASDADIAQSKERRCNRLIQYAKMDA